MERADSKLIARHWRWELDQDRLAWLTFDKQGESANTFSRDALEELGRMLDDIVAATPRGLIIRSAKDSFIAGADIQAFADFKNADEAIQFTKLGWDTFQKLHDVGFPTTAMINGFCMGGGMEMSLACRYRVALDDPKTRLAQPEVMVGVIPAWHAMQWLPELVGPSAAMDMLLTGKAVDAKRAKRMGLVDQAVPLRIFENTARMLTLEAPPRKKLGLMDRLMLGPLKGIVVSQARKQVAKKAKREHYPVPYAILDIWQKYGGNALVVTAGPRNANWPASTQCLALPDGEGRVDLDALMRTLAERGINEVHLEAGAKLNGALLRAGLIDELLIYLAGAVIGDPARGMFEAAQPLASLGDRVNVEWKSIERIGDDLRILARVRNRPSA